MITFSNNNCSVDCSVDCSVECSVDCSVDYSGDCNPDCNPVENDTNDDDFLYSIEDLQRLHKFVQKAYKELDIPLIHTERLVNSGYPFQYNDYVLVKNPYHKSRSESKKYFPIDYRLTNIIKTFYENGLNANGWDQSCTSCGTTAFIHFDYELGEESLIQKLTNMFGQNNFEYERYDQEYMEEKALRKPLSQKRDDYIDQHLCDIENNITTIKSVLQSDIISKIDDEFYEIRQMIIAKRNHRIMESNKIHIRIFEEDITSFRMEFNPNLIPNIHQMLGIEISKERYPGISTMTNKIGPMP